MAVSYCFRTAFVPRVAALTKYTGLSFQRKTRAAIDAAYCRVTAIRTRRLYRKLYFQLGLIQKKDRFLLSVRFQPCECQMRKGVFNDGPVSTNLNH